ncbi:unnamed protein product [Lactuca saligna]|uniref:Ubiquitin-like protease family profile domain-containing protein n=1 Tax=Lactuca saligna TaxID=75948 RepID=A0AA36EQR6_LACSI|nr:unnamed protein product [Lactuca saligna]
MMYESQLFYVSRKKSERILLKTAFSKFTNEESNPLLIDIEDADNEGNELVQPQIRREGQKKFSTPKKKTKNQTIEKNRKPKVNVKKVDGGNSRFSKAKKNIQKKKGFIESYDLTEDSGLNRENELRTKRRFDRCKTKGDEVVVINSFSGKDNVTVKNLDEDEDSDFEADITVVTRKKRRHHTSFKDDDKENVKKFKRQRNKEGNVLKPRKHPKVVASGAEEAKRIQVRTSPNVLYSCMHNLSKEQEAYISSIGLGHLLKMKVDGCASIMGHYIVRNFNADRMVLKLHHGEIPINRQVIHEMLGLPLGHVTIKSMPYREVTDDTITVWRKQFEDEDNIRPRAVQQVIMQSTRADLMFKVNIFVLLCNTLGQSMSMGTCDLSMLSKVTKDLDLSDIDWCGYVFDCLKETKSAWNPNSKKGFYVGPIILLLLLYVESVRCDSVKIVRCRPAICCWSVDKLRERERVECRTIGLGMGELQDPFQFINEASGTGNVGQEKVQGNDAGDVRCKGNHGDDIFSGSGESVETTVSTIKEMYDMILQQKKVLEDKINDAVKKYPDNQLVKEWKNKVNDLFTEVSASEEPEQSQWWYDNEAEIERTLILATTNKQFDNSALAKCSIQMSQEYADFANRSGTKSFKNTPPSKMEMPIPLSVVPFNKDEHWVSRRGYRPRMKSEYLKSPYVIRAVDIIKGVPRQEKRVAEWIFSLQGDPNDIVFHTLDGFSAQRFHMESFFPTCELFGHVIDCWSQVLNLDESKRAPESPLRVYCKTDVTNSYLESGLTESQRKDKFIENLVLSIEDMDASLRFVGLLFLPIIRSFHIFLFVINLQQPEFVIVDNSKVDDPDGERYGQLPQIIKEYIVDYLKSQNHPKAEMFSHVMPHRLEMPWRTINNSIDCGVFTMRHMETYMGGSMNEFKAGFKNESSAQDDQLVKLRTKYLYKILTHEYNVQKDYVLQKVDEFHKIPSKQRSQMLAIAKEEIHRRLDVLS